MLTELINFTETLSDDFKSIGMSPKQGLHILIQVDESGQLKLDSDSLQFEYYPKKNAPTSPFLEKCLQFQNNGWCVDTNKCFDLPRKAIHTCSPFCIAFKLEHLPGGVKYKKNEKKGNPQIQERFEEYYFDKAAYLIDGMEAYIAECFDSFKRFFTKKSWEIVLNDISNKRESKYKLTESKIEQLKGELKKEIKKDKKSQLKDHIKVLQNDLKLLEPLSEKDYLLFYLDIPLEKYKISHGNYLDDKLFNTSDYNTEPDENGLVFGTNNFQNGFNSKMPFLIHQTATFDITGRISNLDARALYDLGSILPRKSLPNPLPIFIYGDELKSDFIALCKENNGKIGYREIIESLYKIHNNDFQNYYLLNWANTRSGIEFNDYDFVSKFRYELDLLKTSNFFNLNEKGKKAKAKGYAPINTIFELEDRVLKPLIQNKYHRVDYFSELKKDEYGNRDMTFLSFCKYRKAVYDYVYKSNQTAIEGKEFTEMIFNAIKDDFKNNNEYGIKEKLNMWYSFYEFFNKSKKDEKTMANKLTEYQDFVKGLIEETANLDDASDHEFAFAAGQLIYYLLSKSKSADTSFRLMEPYLQKTNCIALQKNIAEDFDRYKHENFSNNFKKVSAFVLSYETKKNLKELQPMLLSGLFAKNQLFSNINNKENE